MSQIELRLQQLLNRHPEIERCYRVGLVNRRALARFLVRSGVAAPEELDAVIATVRRHDFGPPEGAGRDLFPEVRLSLKDRILVLDFPKDRELLRRLERLVGQIDYDRGDTLKVVVGTSTIKLFVDQAKEKAIERLFAPFHPLARSPPLSEVSLLFPEEARATPNVLSTVTRELAIRGIVVAELLTASPELLIYLDGGEVPRVIEVVRTLQGDGPRSDRPARTRGRAH